jgi:BirA family biotin operon repressor/biotin-[acetyl-CoA-carboxylase] ligase
VPDASLNRAAERLWQPLAPQWPGLTIEVVAECVSTNTVLMERARRGLAEPALLVARQQTAGRGRQGRAWLSEPDAALLMSLALPLARADAEGWQGLSLAIGVALADALDPAGSRIGLKWPNDLWLRDATARPGQGRKLAGILIETVNAGAAPVAVIGVGINVRTPSAAPPAEAFRSGRAALQELDAEATPASALQAVLPPLLAALLRFETAGLAPFLAAYAARDLLRGMAVTAGEALAGIAEGIDAQGRLLLRDAHGAVQRIGSGEVSVRRIEETC